MLKGNSGCEINDWFNNIFVKSCEGDYTKRLIKQALKQIEYGNMYDNYKVPHIQSMSYYDNKSVPCFSFTMDKIKGYNPLDIILKYPDTYESFLIRLLPVIDNFIKDSPKERVPLYTIIDKIESIEKTVRKSDNQYIKDIQSTVTQAITWIYRTLSCYPDGIELPIGKCHGDYTLSNVIYSNASEIYLFDFLDSFIESPLLDIVKLRQDTHFKWILTKCSDLTEDEINKVNEGLDKFDKTIDDWYSNNKEYKSFYKLFQIINFLRIVPYLKDEASKTNVENALKELLTI